MAKLAVYKPVVGAIVDRRPWARYRSAAVYADPSQDSVAHVSELSREAEQLSETILNAQPDLDKKLQPLSEGGQEARRRSGRPR